MRTCWDETLSRGSDCQNLLIPNLCETSVDFFLLHIGLCLDLAVVNTLKTMPYQNTPGFYFTFFFLTESQTNYFKCSIISQIFLLFVKMIPFMFMKFPIFFIDIWAATKLYIYKYAFWCLKIYPNPSSKAIRGSHIILINGESQPHRTVSAMDTSINVYQMNE